MGSRPINSHYTDARSRVLILLAELIVCCTIDFSLKLNLFDDGELQYVKTGFRIKRCIAVLFKPYYSIQRIMHVLKLTVIHRSKSFFQRYKSVKSN